MEPRPIMTLRVQLHGNPDHGQYAPIGPDLLVVVDSATRAVRLALAHNKEHDGGAGNFQADLSVGEVKIATISYNGSVWPASPWHPGQLRMTAEEVESLAIRLNA